MSSMSNINKMIIYEKRHFFFKTLYKYIDANIYIYVYSLHFSLPFSLTKKKYHIKKFNCSYKYLHNKQIHATERGYSSSDKNQAAFIQGSSFQNPFTTKIGRCF